MSDIPAPAGTPVHQQPVPDTRAAEPGPPPTGPPAPGPAHDPAVPVLRAVLERLKIEALADMAALEVELQTTQTRFQNLQGLHQAHQGHLVILDARLDELRRLSTRVDAPPVAPPGSDPDPALTAAITAAITAEESSSATATVTAAVDAIVAS